MIDLSHHFASDEPGRHSEWLRQQKWFIKLRDDRERREKIEEKLDDTMEALVSAVVMATTEELNELQTRLDAYDEATVIALMENQEKLDRVNAHISQLLDRAYVMEDGRRVFLSEDRTQAFDEFGEPVTPDELDFDMIPENTPTWEQWRDANTEKKELTQERQDILDFQEKIDAAREKTADGKISEQELDDLDADLLEAMPKSVRAHVPDLEDLQDTPELKSHFQPIANPARPQNVRTTTFDANVPG